MERVLVPASGEAPRAELLISGCAGSDTLGLTPSLRHALDHVEAVLGSDYRPFWAHLATSPAPPRPAPSEVSCSITGTTGSCLESLPPSSPDPAPDPHGAQEMRTLPLRSCAPPLALRAPRIVDKHSGDLMQVGEDPPPRGAGAAPCALVKAPPFAQHPGAHG